MIHAHARLRYCFLLLPVILVFDPPPLRAADWPAWRGSANRAAATDAPLPSTLKLHWVLHLPKPRPAWPEQQGKVRFDASYEPVVASGRLFVPSMVQDSLAAYDTATGERIWQTFVDGPVRFAPVVSGDNVLFVSDDGYLYCVAAADGVLRWKFRGGPDGRKVLGNDRLISMWPARGAPVVDGKTVYFAAGIWPFMGVFVHAVDIASGKPVWTNSGSGANYIVQKHNSPAFAGVAPQGYLAISNNRLLVSGGMTVPAAFDLATGKFLYFRPGDRLLGKDQGGYEVVAGNGWFSNRGGLHRLADGEPLVKAAISVLGADRAFGISGKDLIACGTKVVRGVVRSVDKRGNQKKTKTNSLPQLWHAELPVDATTLHVKAGETLVASDDGARLFVLGIPKGQTDPCRLLWQGQIEGTVWRSLVADDRLFVVSEQGHIFCFGDAGSAPDGPQMIEEMALEIGPVGEANRELIAKALNLTRQHSGYAIIDQPEDISLAVALAKATRFHVLVLHSQADWRARSRRALSSHELLGSRVAVVAGTLGTANLPPYMANLILVPASDEAMDEGVNPLRCAFRSLRPYGGTLVVSGPRNFRDTWSALHRKHKLGGDLTDDGQFLTLRRPGGLPGAGSWTSQNGNAGNTLVSQDQRVKTPLGLLWFGGPSNRDVLPRHGHGPVPQVLGGRLFIEGRDMLRAVDVYTGRLLWQRDFPDVGVFYDNTGHHPGAGAIGGNYVCTSDSVYLIWGRRCLRLDPATGKTLAEFYLPPGATGQRPFWGYIAVHGDRLVAGSSPMVLLAPGPEPRDDKERPRDIPVYSQFGEGSHRLVVMDRFTGATQWTREARYNFRHNAIAIGDETVFCLDRMTDQRLTYLKRRGRAQEGEFCLYALDIRTGEVRWQSTRHAFGTWLAFSPQTGLLLQAGSKNRDRASDEVGRGFSVHEAATGKLVWQSDARYGGPPMLYPTKIITQGTAFDLFTGAETTRRHPLTDERVLWKFSRNYGCNTAIGCVNLLTFRSAAAGYFDLANDGGTGNLGGFRTSCTANLIAADGVLSAPDYTRTCTCSYQNQCSVALIHMPDAEMWTFSSISPSGKRVKRLGINFGAPGDRKADDGTLWLDYPSVGGPSPNVPIAISGDSVTYFRRHASLVDSPSPRWVFASGATGVKSIRVRLAARDEAAGRDASYRVRLYWSDARSGSPHSGVGAAKIALQGKQTSPSAVLHDGSIQEFRHVPVSDYLEIRIGDSPASALSGIEITLEP